MKRSDQYHKWVEWSDEDEAYIGKCPDLITGIHGDDPQHAVHPGKGGASGTCGALVLKAPRPRLMMVRDIPQAARAQHI